ncbi:MAG: ATP-binding protein [Syntrophobacteraceae bacterium]
MKTGAATPGMRFGAAVVSALALLLFASGSVFAEGQARRNILVISPFDRSLPFSLSFFSGLNSALEPHDLNTFEFFQENLDVDRIQNGEYLDSLAAFLNSKYAGKKFDAIVTLNEWALDFLIGRCGSISPGTPVVAAGVSREKSAGERAGREIIPVWSEGDTAERTIDLILHLQPKAKKIYIVLGAHPYERARWSYLREALTSYTNGPEFVFIPNSRYEEVLGAVRRLNANDAVLVLLFMRDGAGRAYHSQYVAGKISQTAGCPVYGIADTFLGHGIVGGDMFPTYLQGRVSGRVLIGLFGARGLTAGSEETRVPLIRQVDERAMVRWGLSEKNLPEGYEVVNRSPSLLRDYKGHVVVALLFFFAQSGLIFRLLVLSRTRRAAEQELRRTCKDLEENQEELSRSRALQESALEDLRESEATLQSILASIPVGVLVIDAGTRTVQIANRAAAELLDMPLEEMPGCPCPECFEAFVADAAAVCLNDGANSLEDRILTGPGREVYVLKTVDRVFLGGKTHLIGCLLDITGRKAAERDAREKEEQLVHADKMISLGTMAAGIGHEIHNPNTFILLNAPVLKKTWEDVLERLDEYAEENGDFLIGKVPYSQARILIPALLDGIIEGSERIRNIVRDMREFMSRKSSGEIEMVDVNAVLRSSLNFMASKLSKATDNLLVEYGENIPTVKANAQRLEQVAMNLILNGVESLTDKEKLLSVRTYYEPERAMVGLEVRDNGSGIEPEHLPKVFDPFFTTKRETGGTGLGLAISQKIIEAYGGRIAIVSTPGEGTTAIIELPAYGKDK